MLSKFKLNPFPSTVSNADWFPYYFSHGISIRQAFSLAAPKRGVRYRLHSGMFTVSAKSFVLFLVDMCVNLKQKESTQTEGRYIPSASAEVIFMW